MFFVGPVSAWYLMRVNVFQLNRKFYGKIVQTNVSRISNSKQSQLLSFFDANMSPIEEESSIFMNKFHSNECRIHIYIYIYGSRKTFSFSLFGHDAWTMKLNKMYLHFAWNKNAFSASWSEQFFENIFCHSTRITCALILNVCLYTMNLTDTYHYTHNPEAKNET